MPYIIVNGNQIPKKDTQDVETPNFADAFETLSVASMQNKSTVINKEDLLIPGNGVFYFVSSTEPVTVSDGDFKTETESGTNDLVWYVRRSGVWEEYDRAHKDTTHISRIFSGETFFTHVAEAESDDGNTFVNDTNDQNRVAANLIVQLAPGESAAGLPVVLNTQGSAGTSDSTSLIRAFVAVVSGDAAAEKIAYSAQPGFTHALKVSATPALAPVAGYVYNGTTVTDRSTEFQTPGSDVQIFVNDNNTIIIGYSSPFSILEVDLVTAANQDILSEYQYSTGNDTWAPLTINSDGTNGFSNTSGQITFNAPGGWNTSNLYQGTSTTALYYIEIKRTRNGLATIPVESQFKVFSTGGSDMFIHGNGCIEPVTISDIFAQNNCIYFSSDQNTLCWKDKGGTVQKFDLTAV